MPYLAICVFWLLSTGALYLLIERLWGKKVLTLERDLQHLSEVMSEMAEIQVKSYQEIRGNLGDIEERILDLAVPSTDPNAPLERRHHVLSLARKGVGVEEISKRLNVPRGEAELIVNLRKFADPETPKVAQMNGEGKRHAKA